MTKLYQIKSRGDEAISKLDYLVEGVLLSYAEGTRPSYRGVWKQFETWSAQQSHLTILDIGAIQAQEFITHYSQRSGFGARIGYRVGIGRSTLKKVAGILKSMFDRLYLELDIQRPNPFAPVLKRLIGAESKARRPTELVPYDRIDDIVNSPGKTNEKSLRDTAILSLMFGAGLRRAEIGKLNVGNVKVLDGKVSIILLNTKNGDDAEQFIADDFAAAVAKYREIRVSQGAQSNAPLFNDYRGVNCRPSERRISDSTIYSVFKSALKKCKLPDNLSPHSARATCVTRLLDLGVHHRQVAIFSRHKSIQMVELYDKRRSDQELNPASKLTFKTSSDKKLKKR